MVLGPLVWLSATAVLGVLAVSICTAVGARQGVRRFQRERGLRSGRLGQWRLGPASWCRPGDLSSGEKNVNRKILFLSGFVLTAAIFALLLWAPDVGEPSPAPQVVQDGITVSSTEGPVATWGRGLERPVEAAVTVDAVAPVVNSTARGAR